MSEPTPSELSTAADMAEVEEGQRPPRMPAFLSVLIMREGPGWIAQVLEHDLATQAAKREDIEYEIERLIVGHVTACRSQGLNPFELPPAPSQYRDLYEHATWFKTVADWSGWDVAGLLPTLEIAEWFEQTDCSPVTGRPYECPEAEAMLGAEASVGPVRGADFLAMSKVPFPVTVLATSSLDDLHGPVRRGPPTFDEVRDLAWWWNFPIHGEPHVLQLDVTSSGEIVYCDPGSAVFEPDDWPGEWAPCRPPGDDRASGRSSQTTGTEPTSVENDQSGRSVLAEGLADAWAVWELFPNGDRWEYVAQAARRGVADEGAPDPRIQNLVEHREYYSGELDKARTDLASRDSTIAALRAELDEAKSRFEECAKCGQVGPVDVACSGCALAQLKQAQAELAARGECAIDRDHWRQQHGDLADGISSLVIAHVRPCVVRSPLENLTRIGGMLRSLAGERDRAVRLHQRALARIRTLGAKGKRRATRSRR